MPEGRVIDLLPEIPEEVVQKVEKKGKQNVFALFSILFIGFAAIFILLGNLAAQIEYNVQNDRLAETRGEIIGLQYVELKQKTFNVKMDTYRSVTSHDFSSDVVLTYLLDVANQLSTVKSMYLDDAMNFSINGTTDSYMNVARIWHDMSKDKNYFQWVDLKNVSKDLEADDPGNSVSYSFSGTLIRENVDNL